MHREAVILVVHFCISLNVQLARSPHQQQLSLQRPLPIYNDLLHANLQSIIPPSVRHTPQYPRPTCYPSAFPRALHLVPRPRTPSHPVLREVEMSRDPISGRGLTTPAYRVQRERAKSNRADRVAWSICQAACGMKERMLIDRLDLVQPKGSNSASV
jgi:hypothetical protein